MRIKLTIETTEGEFSIMREIKPRMEATPGLMGVFGAKSTANDAYIGEARAVLDVLPTIITAVNSEYADIAAQKTRAEVEMLRERVETELAEYTSRVAEVDARIRQLFMDGIRAGKARVALLRDARELAAKFGVEKPSLKDLVERHAQILRAYEDELRQVDREIVEDAKAYVAEVQGEGPEVLVGDGEGESLPPIKDDEPA